MGYMAKKKRGLTEVLDELDDPFPPAPTKKQRTSERCRHCGETVRLREPGGGVEFVAHDGPCGLKCLGGGVSIGLPFHDEQCSHPRCQRLTIPIPGIPRRRGGR